jgi:hypothetical protein
MVACVEKQNHLPYQLEKKEGIKKGQRPTVPFEGLSAIPKDLLPSPTS